MEKPAKSIDTTDFQLPDVLSRVATELRRVECLTTKIESTLLEIVSSRTEFEWNDLTNIQHLDHQVQILKDLAGFLEDLSSVVPSDQVVDLSAAVSRLSLADVASALSSGAAKPLNSDGDMEML